MVLSAQWLAKRRRIPCLHFGPTDIGAGCSPEISKVIEDYLDDIIDAGKAVSMLTELFALLPGSIQDLIRFWTMLSKVIVALPDDSERAIELIAAVKSRPQTPGLAWPQLPQFDLAWHNTFNIFLYTEERWGPELSYEDRNHELRAFLASIGRAESIMYLRNEIVPAAWGYQALSMVCWDRPDLDVLLSYIYAWMLASDVLKSETEPWDVERYRYSGHKLRSCTMEEHWEYWVAEYLKLSKDGSLDPRGRLLSDEGRALAGGIYMHIRGGMWDGEGARGISSVTGV